ncbi:MAG: DUF4342 domain-containing protein [Balneola sp.]|jgi:hypothetical protein|uniref:DUF4342 domain-containing protein n=1 Tax=Balneola sp. EhC07 TaxID=1849360 RepID=UPI0007F350FC|nr:DUF4342 domain-containing protein [Balneola sp. EhC07]OAN63031.1 hypothetical protein A8B79_02045 [Balneola sp. EhC07]|tara:strand:+ start:90752 stop:91180 length:429 start_codon:yes stop_codon:yes gene_type:complete
MKKEEAKSKAKRVYEEIQGGVNEVISSIRELIKEGSARKLIIKNKEGEVVFQTQLAFGVGGAALVGAMAPVISAIGMFAMFINDYQILVEKEVDPEDDDYSVDAEVIEITEDEDEEEENTEEAKAEETEEKEEKTVGKKKKK